MGHRHGAKKRPECDGEVIEVSPVGAEPWAQLAPIQGPTAPSTPSTPEGSDPPLFSEGELETPNLTTPWEWTGRAEAEDPEEIARQINLSRQAAPPRDGDGGGLHLIGEGDWEADIAQGPISSAREQVVLPATMRVMYDYCRSQGWLQGDGSMSSWVTDVILDWWVNRYGMAIVVARREEVGLNGHA